MTVALALNTPTARLALIVQTADHERDRVATMPSGHGLCRRRASR